MKRSKRLQRLCAEIKACTVFADVGCDHGYCAEYVLKNGLSGRCYISDISAASLKKAERLLSEYIAEGIAYSFCCAGMELIPKDADQVLIAGMGGEEILSILREGFLPERLVLQPMKNAAKVRKYLLEEGYSITRDYTFFDGKYYDVICAERCAAVREYDEKSVWFGYDNLHHPTQEFLDYLKAETEKCERQKHSAPTQVQAVEERLGLLREVWNEASRNL